LCAGQSDLLKAALKLCAVGPPPRGVQLLNHHFDDHDAIVIDLSTVIPQPLRGSVRMQRDADKRFGEFYLTLSIEARRSVLPLVGSRISTRYDIGRCSS
jgi:hypothetical protein